MVIRILHQNRSESERREYRKRLVYLWKPPKTNNELMEATEQRLTDQVRKIKKKKCLEIVEQEEIALRVINELQGAETTELIQDTSNHVTTSDTQKEHQSEGSIPADGELSVSTPEVLQEEISPELKALRDRILEVILLQQRVGLPSLKSCDRAKLRAEVGKFNEAAKRIQTHSIPELNSLLYAAAYVTT